MKQKINRILPVVLGLFLGFFIGKIGPSSPNANIGWASEAKLEALVDKQTAQQNEEINLSIRLTNAQGNIAAPRLPNFTGFDTFYSGRASHFTFINGRSSSSTEFSYVLVPKAAGVFTIEPIEMSVDGKLYRTDPIQIEILGAQNQPAPPVPPQGPARSQMPQGSPAQAPQSSQPLAPGSPPPIATEGADQNIFLRANPSKRTVYSNEQLLLTYSLLTRYDTRYEGFENEPETSGFWVEEFPIERDLGKQTETLNGKRYVRADIKKLALFPTAPGEYVIKPGSVRASVQIEQNPSSLLDEFFNDSFFNNSGVFSRRVDKILAAQSISITVKPLPEEGKPKSFNGAVGQFKMFSGVDKRVVNQNEPVTLKVVIEGSGNIETLTHPKVPEIPDVKIFDADTKSELFKAENLVAGKKTYEIIFIPKLAGSLEIPSLEFSYFDPSTESYMTLKTDSAEIRVNPSRSPLPELPKELAQETISTKQEIRATGKDIRYIHERLEAPSRLPRLFLTLLFFANAALSAACLFLIVKQRQDEFLTTNISLKRNRHAKRNAQKMFRRLVRLVTKENQKGQQVFFDEAERLMNQYLADKCNLSPQGLTQEVIAEKLSERGVSGDVLKKIEGFYEICGLVRFGKMGTFETGSQEILESIRDILKEEF